MWTWRLGVIMAQRAYTHHLISETDFFIKEDLMDGATHALIVNVSGASNLPSYLLASFRDSMKTVGHMSSKHSLTQPHRVLCESPPTWPILRYENTLFIIVNGPAVITNKAAAQRNEWLFNYPPARDIALFLMEHMEKGKCATLSTWALNSLFTEGAEEDTDSCAYVPVSDWSTDDAPASLQDLWSWVPPALYESLTDGEGGIFIMPAESTSSSSTEARPVLTPALFPEITDLLRSKGFDIPEEAEAEAKVLYEDAVEEAMERIREIMGAMPVKEKNEGVGGMFA